MKKIATKIVALLLVICTLSSLLLACESTNITTEDNDNNSTSQSTSTNATEEQTGNEETTDDPIKKTENDPEDITETKAEATEDALESEADTETETVTETKSEEETQAKTETETQKAPETSDTAKDELVLFENGAYAMNVIRSDEASEDDKTLYEALRSALYDHTGKRPSVSTDYKLADKNKNAILVGNTDYQQSKDAMIALEKGQAIAMFVDDKYVIAYTTQESMFKLISALTSKIKKASKDKIVIDKTWEMEVAVTPLKESIALPAYDGKALNSPIDLGQGSELYIFSNTTSSKFSKYVSNLISLGFQLYAYNEIANNEYYTLITETQIVTAMYLKNSSETRIIQDSRETIELTGTEEENIYQKTSSPSFTMMGISDSGYPGGMSFIFKLSDGTFFIIDGGICANRTGSNECGGDPSVNRLFNTLQSLADDKDNIVISGWLITHIHNDHAGAFIDLAEKPDYLKKLTIKKVIYSQPADSDMTDSNQPKRLNWMPNAVKKMGIEKTVKAHPGQVFYFADLKLTILGTHDLIKPTKISRHNNASIVSMVEFGGKKMLFLADAEGDSNEKLKLHYGSALDADILQVAHHGYNNTNAGIVYPYVTPQIVLWPIQTSDWKSGDNVYNISFNLTYLNKSGITHYCAGAANITFGNLSTWAPTKQNWKP